MGQKQYQVMPMDKFRTSAWLGAALMLLAWGCRPPDPGPVLSVGLENDVLGLDPHRHDENVTYAVMDNIYDHLVDFDPQMRIVPSLAVSWENPNENVWRFHLRPNVVFHNGTPCDAGDVKYSLDRARRMELGHYLAAVKEVRIIDGLTLEIQTSRPSPILLNQLTFIAIVPQGQPDTIVHPVGTGPYRFVSRTPGQELVLERHPGYWGQRPKIQTVKLRFYEDRDQRLEALVRGEVQLARDINRAGLSRRQDAAHIQLEAIPGLSVGFLGFNLSRSSPFSRRAVRQAVYWAVDPQRWLEQIEQDALPNHQFVSPYIVGYLPDYQPQRPDLDKARRLLAQAGYPKGSTSYLEVTTAAVHRSARVIVEQLGRVGIKVRVRAMTWPELSDRLNKRRSPFFLVGWGCSSGDASDLLNACLHSPDARSFGSANWGGYHNPQLDRLIEQIGSTMDPRQRISLLHQAMALVLEEMPLVPVFTRSRTYAYDRRLCFTARLDGSLDLARLKWGR